MNLPIYYEDINAVNAYDNPGTVHCRNTALQRYFARYLLQKCFSIFEFENFPDFWERSYFDFILFTQGRIAIFNEPKFGLICQQCTLNGRGVYYQPTRALISNPVFGGNMSYDLTIDDECVLLRLTPDYCGVMDIVNFHADMLALSAESAGANLVNTKLAYVFGVGNKASAESMKKLYDEVQAGNPAVFPDKNLLDPEGKATWQPIFQNLTQNYIAGTVTEDMAKWDARFNTLVGIPNVNISKMSGVTSDEVNANNTDTQSISSVWLEELTRGVEKVNAMFGTNIRVKRRFEAPTNDENGKDDKEYARGEN